MEQRYIGFHPSVKIYLLREEDLENGASFLRLRLPSALIRHDEGTFRKRCSNCRNQFKMQALRFSEDRKHFENEAFGNR